MYDDYKNAMPYVSTFPEEKTKKNEPPSQKKKSPKPPMKSLSAAPPKQSNPPSRN
jgi:hypothetical protein